MKTLLVGTLVISLLVVTALVTTTHVQAVRSGAEKNDAANRLQQSFGKLPISFEKNQGQAEAQVKYLARGSGYGIFLKPHEAVLRLRGKDDKAGYATVQMQFLQSNAAALLQALEPQTSTSNYFLGNNPRHWQTKVQSFGRVRYQNLYPGIELIYYGNQQRIEYDFVVAPHANPNKINLNFQGVQTSCLDQNGDLLLQTSNGEIRQLKPQAYQEINGTRQSVAAEYVIDQQRHVSFRLGAYDRSQPLIIDPVILYSTFLGGSSNDIGRAIAVGKDGSVYVLGETFSVDFPGTGSLQSSNKGVQDVFVLKMNAAGTKLDYATWLGGSNNEQARGLSVDDQGNAYLSGATASTDFPVTATAYQKTKDEGYDAFVAKINPTGTALVYATLLGGNDYEIANDVTVDANGNAYLAGSTLSNNLPANGLQTTRKGNSIYKSNDKAATWTATGAGINSVTFNGLVFDPITPTNVYASTLQGLYKSTDGGNQWQHLNGGFFSTYAIAINPVSPAILYAGTDFGVFKSTDSGATWQLKNNGFQSFVPTIVVHPQTPQIVFAGTRDGMFKSIDGAETWTALNNGMLFPQYGTQPPPVNKVLMDRTNPQILYAATQRGFFKTINGGANWTKAQSGLPVSGSDPNISNAYADPSNVNTLYALLSTPTAGLYKTTDGGANWSLVTTNIPVNVAGQTITFPLGTIAIDPASSATIYATSSGNGVFKSTDGGQSWTQKNTGILNLSVALITFTPNGDLLIGTHSGAEGFIAKLNPTGSALTFLTYLGGSENDALLAIALDAGGNIVVTGGTTSPNFPTVNALQATHGGSDDAVVVKVNSSGTALLWSTYLGGSGSDFAYDLALGKNGQIFLTGITTSSNFPTMNPLQANIKGNANGFVTKLKADGSALEYSTYLGGTATDGFFSLALDSADNAYVAGYTYSNDFPQVDPAQVYPFGPYYGYYHIVAAKLNPAGSALVFATYLGGSGQEAGYGIAVDARNQVYLTGFTSSAYFPIVNGLQPFARTPYEAFVVKLGVEADVSVTQAQARNPVMVNNNQTYAVTVTNNGPSPANGVKLTDVLPAGVNFVSVTPSQGTCANTSGTITCDLGTITKQQSATIEIIVKPTIVGKITHVVSVTGIDPDSTQANNQATLETTISSLPSIGGRVVDGAGKGVAGIKISLSGGAITSAVTDANGYYQIKDLPLGANFTVTPIKDGNSFELPSRDLTNVSTDQTVNFTATICAYSLFPTLQEFTLAGGANTVSVIGTVRCPWAATVSPEAAGWLKITGTTTGIGNGAITYTVAPSSLPRRGYIRVAGQNIAIYQRASSVCAVPSFRQHDFFLSNSVSGIIPADLNGDQLPEFVLAGGGYSQLLNKSVGSIDIVSADIEGNLTLINQLQVETTNGAGVIAIAGKDFNRDLKNDIVAVDTNSGKVTVFWNDGTAKFTQQTFNLDMVPRGGLINLEAADLDQDGYPDLIAGVYNNTTSSYGVKIALNNKGNGFLAPYFVGLNNQPLRAFADVTGDGIADIVTQGDNYSSTSLTVFPGDGIGSFGAPITSTYAVSGQASSVSSSAFGDFNSDGYLDIVLNLGHNANNTYVRAIAFIPGLGNGKFGTAIFSDITNYSNELRLTVGDFNGDGRLDIIGINGQERHYFAGAGEGKFTDTPGIASLGEFQSAQTVAVDLNRDGKDEIIFLDQSNRKLIVNLNRCANVTTPGIYGNVRFGYVNLANITVNLSRAKTASTKTDAFGNYEFIGLTSGANYDVKIDTSGYVFTPAVTNIVSLTNEQRADFNGVKKFVAVPATTYIPGFIARGSLISIFGIDFTDTTAIATTVPLPTELGGVTVTIGGEKAKLLYVSPGQINLQVPDALANMEQDTVIFSTRPYPQSIFGKISIFDTSPGLFSANSDGTGAAAASVIYVTGTTLRYDVAATCLPGQRCTTKPIDVRAADNVFLELYGSGIRYYHSFIQAEIAGIEAEVTYSGAHCCFVGVDQVNVKIPKILVARGEVDLRLIVDGNPANIIKIFLK